MKTPFLFVVATCLVGLSLFPDGALAADKKKKKPDADEPPQNPPGQAQGAGVRSQDSTTSVQLLVTNLTGQPVEMVWVNYSGGQQSYGQLPPQQPGDQPTAIATYATHVWIFKLGGRVLLSHTATAARQQQVTLGGGGGGGFVAGGKAPKVPRTVGVDPGTPVVPRTVEIDLAPGVPPRVVVPRANPEGARAPAEVVEFLQVHNQERVRVGAPPLRWSDTLARHAQEWADQLASTGTFKHRDQSQTGYGENLFGGSDGFTPGDAARQWMQERAAYKGGPVTNENFMTVGHYTQMVWSTTTEVGYGIARGRNGVVVVANYSPAGNFSGRKPY